MSDGTWGVYGAGIFGDDLPVVTPTPTPVPGPAPDAKWVAADPGLTLIGTNGDVIRLRVTEGDYAVLLGATGFGIPPKVLTMFEGAGDGATVRYVRTGSRDIDIPIGIFGDSRGDVGDRQRRLASALRNRPGRLPARLQFVLESGEIYETSVYYVAGAETQITGTDGSATFARWPVTLRCPDPYWTSTTETSFQLGGGGSTRGLLPKLTKLQLAPSQVLGAVEVNNSGDVDADLVWEITGPGGPFTAASETGQSFTITDLLQPGETITVNTKTGAVTDQSGSNRYASLGPAPKLFKLPDGLSTVKVTLTGVTAASRVVFRYKARREVVY